ncbi:GTP-binding protein EngA [Anaerohalosphaera lusitana]|uniref:GTPase Der n=1 Tax=Anaerohalosphaera lusitana TaxID=1936003 RepID=A0A1U9NHT2_9BACT|nr:ribosome biogenesis GTPase Der [Anaerohalosphaera lusitana]AQT67304.1 GTP-binding protein EngA [Anaerohalosphaera lusitana]
MALPVVTIVGRPNVGKSSLLNSLAGEMISIVESTAGVTRDRVSTLVELNGRYVELVDTGGYGIVDEGELTRHVEEQINNAVAMADVVLFVVDIRDGIMPLDQDIAQMLRKHDLDVILVANKADSPKQLGSAGEFQRLGFGEAIPISATNFVNRAELLEKVSDNLSHMPVELPKRERVRIAVVGKRNAGKSTFINSVVGETRVIASDIPGTTRDAVDVIFDYKGEKFCLIDTAGVRKKRKMSNSIEYYSYTRAARSIKRADVVLFMVDSTLPLSQPDKKLAAMINEEYKACILVINKWDLANDAADPDDYLDYVDKMLPGMRHCPIAFTTATTGENLENVLHLTTEVFQQASTEVPTPKLNKAIETISEARIGGSKRGIPKIYYATQVAVRPVSLLLFVNDPGLFNNTFKRFAINKLREMLDLEEVPIRLMFRRRH